MSTVRYTALRKLEKTGFKKVGTDIAAAAVDDAFDASVNDLAGLLADQWIEVAGFVNAANNGWFQVKQNSVTGKILQVTAPITHLRLPGASGNFASTLDSVAVSQTGDSSLRVRAILYDWTPAAIRYLVGQWGAAGQRARKLEVLTNGKFRYSWSENGTDVLTAESSVATGIADGAVKYAMVTHDADNGASGNDVKFWLSDDGITWSQLGTTVTGGATTSVHNSTATLTVGAEADGATGVFAGQVFYADLRATSGTGGSAVAAFDASRGTRTSLSILAATGETWTVHQSGTPPAQLQGRALVTESAGPNVTITGYYRGLNQDYTIEFAPEAIDPSTEDDRTEHTPIGGGKSEVYLYRSEDFVQVRTGTIEQAAIGQWKEFFGSVAAGEQFIFDAYGTVAEPDDPQPVEKVSKGHEESRDGTEMRYRVGFKVKYL